MVAISRLEFDQFLFESQENLEKIIRQTIEEAIFDASSSIKEEVQKAEHLIRQSVEETHQPDWTAKIDKHGESIAKAKELLETIRSWPIPPDEPSEDATELVKAAGTFGRSVSETATRNFLSRSDHPGHAKHSYRAILESCHPFVLIGIERSLSEEDHTTISKLIGSALVSKMLEGRDTYFDSEPTSLAGDIRLLHNARMDAFARSVSLPGDETSASDIRNWQ